MTCPVRFAGLAAMAAASALALAAPAAAGNKGWLTESATVTKEFTLADASGRRELVIDNVIGSIDVKVGSGDRVAVTIKQTWEAHDADEMAEAKSQVELEVRDNPGKLELVQGGPWRCPSNRGPSRGDGDSWERDSDCCCNHWDERDWQVRYDWTVTVPKNVDLTVKSVNDGAIRIEGVAGRLRVRHVNDDVTVVDVGGRVDAKTVNGELKVDFASLPAGDSSFATVNGDIDLGFPKGLGAELTFDTLNGEVYTDFPFTMSKKTPPPPPSTAERGRHRHEIGRKTAATLGGGGIAIDCDTVNGDITIRERG